MARRELLNGDLIEWDDAGEEILAITVHHQRFETGSIVVARRTCHLSPTITIGSVGILMMIEDPREREVSDYLVCQFPETGENRFFRMKPGEVAPVAEVFDRHGPLVH